MWRRFNFSTTVTARVWFLMLLTTGTFWVPDEMNAPEDVTGAVKLSWLEVTIYGGRRVEEVGVMLLVHKTTEYVQQVKLPRRIERNGGILHILPHRQ